MDLQEQTIEQAKLYFTDAKKSMKKLRKYYWWLDELETKINNSVFPYTTKINAKFTIKNEYKLDKWGYFSAVTKALTDALKSIILGRINKGWITLNITHESLTSKFFVDLTPISDLNLIDFSHELYRVSLFKDKSILSTGNVYFEILIYNYNNTMYIN